MTTTATKLPAVVIPPEFVNLLLQDLDMVHFAAFCRLKQRCDASNMIGIYRASWEELAEINIDQITVLNFLGRGLIYWMEHRGVQIISIVERRHSFGKTYSNCGASNPPTNYYCYDCGAKL